MFLKISQNSQENSCARVQRHRYFPANFVKLLRTPSPAEHLRWLLLLRGFRVIPSLRKKVSTLNLFLPILPFDPLKTSEKPSENLCFFREIKREHWEEKRLTLSLLMTRSLSLVSYFILCVNPLYEKHSNKSQGMNYLTNDPWLKVKPANCAQTAKQLILIFFHLSLALKFAHKAYRLKQHKVKRVGLG